MITKSDSVFFDKARQIAMISDFVKPHVGCVAVYKGNVIAVGFNTNKTHPTQQYYNRYRKPKDETKNLLPKLHAEMNCLNQLKHLKINPSKVKLYVYRIKNKKNHGMSRPCPSCMAAICDMGIRHIYYTTDDGFSYEHLEIAK